MSSTRLFPAAGLAAALTLAFAAPNASASPAQHGIESRVLHLGATSPGQVPLHSVIRNQRELAQFPGWFAAKDATTAHKLSSLAATDFSKNALVGWVENTGCATATNASLQRNGNQLKLRVTAPKPPPECLVANRVAVVFEVPKSKLPAHPVFGPARVGPDTPGPGRTDAFAFQVSASLPAGQPDQAEVTRGDQLDAFLSRLPHGDEVRRQLNAVPMRSDEKRFAYVVSACRPNGADFVISWDGTMSAVPYGGENVRCFVPNFYVAVATVPENLVPVTPAAAR